MITGSWVSTLPLPREPVSASQVSWEAHVPPGASLAVETSVDEGASWHVASNGGPVPQLPLGEVGSAGAVLTRVTFTRSAPEALTPRLHLLEVEVAMGDRP